MPFTSVHQEALELEVSIVDALLRRNRCMHQRTRYYQRLSMAHRCLQKHALLKMWVEADSLHSDLTAYQKRGKIKQKRQEVFWELQPSAGAPITTATERDEFEQRLRRIFVQMDHFPEAMSRLKYSSEAFFTEIARGFFLPFCTVGLAAIARIRSLFLQMLQQLLESQLTQMESLWNELYPTSSAWSRESVHLCRDLLAQASIPQPATNVTEQTLRNLSIPLPLSRTIEDESIEVKEISPETMAAGIAPDSSINDDSDDIGQVLHQMMADEDANSNVHQASHVSEEINYVTGMNHSDTVDKNMVLVEEIRASKKEMNRKRKETALRSDEPSRKKRATSKKKDFFDELFS